jgi:hypothetical protein
MSLRRLKLSIYEVVTPREEEEELLCTVQLEYSLQSVIREAVEFGTYQHNISPVRGKKKTHTHTQTHRVNINPHSHTMLIKINIKLSFPLGQRNDLFPVDHYCSFRSCGT